MAVSTDRDIFSYSDSVFIFGAQALPRHDRLVQYFKSQVIGSQYLHWVQPIISSLISYWPVIIKELPSLRSIPGQERLANLQSWIEDKSPEDIEVPLPNVLLTPLIVLIELVEYRKYLELLQQRTAQGRLSSINTQSCETAGFCTGLLSAFAVSKAADSTLFNQNAAVAVRLALLIGALVDLESSASDEETKCLSASWSSPEMQVEIDEILQRFPGTYTSVVFDSNRITITTPENSAKALSESLRSAGFTTKEVCLRGKFHCQNVFTYNLQAVLDFCDSYSDFQFSPSSNNDLRTRSDVKGEYILSDDLHQVAIRQILIEQCEWYQTVSKIIDSRLLDGKTSALIFGPDRCIPNSLTKDMSSQIVYMSDFLNPMSANSSPKTPQYSPKASDEAIAVIGISCKVAGANDLEEFWKILCAGESQHTEVPNDRFTFDTAFRANDQERRWYGNFIRDHDAFDHKFFKKSPREAASMDPQQRLMLQAAYQAVEQSGYFQLDMPDQHVGCYVGCGTVDYENNVACHPASAYTATGNLKSFIAGKISHHFGWTGPSMTIDTACSASAVAVHQACRAILSGDCNAAIAGGTMIMTSPQWFQNLAGACFLSPTGACKPFDAAADGYCRGEGIGAVFLKKLSSAISDGDQVLGIIASTAVYQNENCTPITVPNAKSLSSLFSDVVKRAGLRPDHISVVEAHGTGTPVGDPAEYEGIRSVLAGSNRDDTLSLGSVKGLVGHTECASGIIALIKVLLMIQESAVPPQASHTTINPAIQTSPTDHIEITTKLKPWTKDFRAALINNYGASGSNASMVVTQPPAPSLESVAAISHCKQPFWLCGSDEISLRSYVARFLGFLRSKRMSSAHLTLPNLSFNMSRQSNYSLPFVAAFSCSSVAGLEETLTSIEKGDMTTISTTAPDSKPLILCFGGQVSSFVGLDRVIFESVKVLRNHLNDCDAVCQALGFDSIYPHIFSLTPIADTVNLQCALFALQYSTAKAWIDCGVKVTATVGHSFGELTALCITGQLSLKDTVYLIASRARLVRDKWGPEKGSMLAIEASIDDVLRLLSESNNNCPEEAPASIACYNGPRSFTIAGSAKSIDAVQETVLEIPSSTPVRVKRLGVTNSFHCSLVDPILQGLEAVGESLTFRPPNIPMERATESSATETLDSNFVSEHMRNPVYFNNAVQRLAKKYPSALWLEAGSNSTITAMAKRALDSVPNANFFGVNITSDGSMQKLVDTTINLWRQGLRVSWWPHHRVQTQDYTPILLPPRQFEKFRHWLEWKQPQQAIKGLENTAEAEKAKPEQLFVFAKYHNEKQTAARYSINTRHPKFQEYVSGHTIAQAAPLCPSTFQFDTTIEALRHLNRDIDTNKFQPELCYLENLAPLGLDSSVNVWLDVERVNDSQYSWDWKWISHSANNDSRLDVHVTGRIIFRSIEDHQLLGDFARYGHLVQHKHCLDILNSNEADDIIQGRNVYRIFADIVDYGEIYRGVQKVVGQNNESAGRISKAYTDDTWLDTPLSDCFCQVAGIAINCMTDKPYEDIFISNRIEQWVRSPGLSRGNRTRPEFWDVLAYHRQPADKKYVSDVFIFDPRDGELVEMIFGISYQRVPKASLARVLKRLSKNDANDPKTQMSKPLVEEIAPQFISDSSQPLGAEKPAVQNSLGSDIPDKLKALVADMTGLEASDLNDGTILADIGVDSLMAMELTREIEMALKCELDTTELYNIVSFSDLLKCVRGAVGLAADPDDKSNHSGDTEWEQTTRATSVAEAPTPKEYSTIEITDIVGVSSPEHPTMLGAVDIVSDGTSSPAQDDQAIPQSAILESFSKVKNQTDDFISEYQMGDYFNKCLPRQTEMCVAHIVEAFEKLGCPFKSAEPGQVLKRINYLPKYQQFVDYLYIILEKEARLIDIHGSTITRTAASAPSKSAEALLADLVHNFPEHANDHNLTHHTGSKLAECLKGDTDGIQLLFGSQDGRELCSSLYGKSPINTVWLKQMEAFIKELASRLPKQFGPLKIFEMGAGTGGTTAGMSQLLTSLNNEVEYTFSDLSPSLVAAARKRFKHLPFMRFRVHDIEKEPPVEIAKSQHIVIANNCVHATRSLKVSTAAIRNVLRPDGFLMMVEMTDKLYWVDLIFGLLEGWWLFDDGRKHAVTHQNFWQYSMNSVGFGHIDYTEGHRPEADLQRIIIALKSGKQLSRLPLSQKPEENPAQDASSRQAMIDSYVRKYSEDFHIPVSDITSHTSSNSSSKTVLVTGATGSLGCYIVEHFASLSTVDSVICINRRSSSNDPKERQMQAIRSKGIRMQDDSISKLKVFETDTSKPLLGFTESIYNDLVNTVTDIVINAWPMSITRPLSGFEPQMQTMRNFIYLARDIATQRSLSASKKLGFSFISSIATVGLYPVRTGQVKVPEDEMAAASILPSGYSEGKLACERILSETLGQHADSFNAFSVRIGQIAGSKASGYWNPVEHFAFLLKSAQVLKAFPELPGELSWLPVEDVASTIGDLLFRSNEGRETIGQKIYHIENPTRQPWSEMISLLASELDVPMEGIISFDEWLKRVRQFPGSLEDNPAIRVASFLEDHFLRMSCGGLIMDTTKSRKQSETLASVGRIDEQVVKRYIAAWKESGFLWK